MANNQDKGGDHTRRTDTDMGKAGQQGGHGSTGNMTDRPKGGQQTGQRPEEKTNRERAQSQGTGRQGGQSRGQPDDRENLSNTGKGGGHQRGQDQGMDKNR